MEVVQPAAKMLVELSKSQDIVAGDGTTTGTSFFAIQLTRLAVTDAAVFNEAGIIEGYAILLINGGVSPLQLLY